MPAGDVFTVLDGPVCAEGFAWYQVEFIGIIGWTPEGDNEDYWLEPMPEEQEIDESACMITADGIVNQRSGPGTSYDAVGQLSSGQVMEVIGQAQSTSGFVWWKLSDNSWVREDTIILSGICSGIPEVSS